MPGLLELLATTLLPCHPVSRQGSTASFNLGGRILVEFLDPLAVRLIFPMLVIAKTHDTYLLALAKVDAALDVRNLATQCLRQSRV